MSSSDRFYPIANTEPIHVAPSVSLPTHFLGFELSEDFLCSIDASQLDAITEHPADCLADPGLDIPLLDPTLFTSEPRPLTDPLLQFLFDDSRTEPNRAAAPEIFDSLRDELHIGDDSVRLTQRSTGASKRKAITERECPFDVNLRSGQCDVIDLQFETTELPLEQLTLPKRPDLKAVKSIPICLADFSANHLKFTAVPNISNGDIIIEDTMAERDQFVLLSRTDDDSQSDRLVAKELARVVIKEQEDHDLVLLETERGYELVPLSNSFAFMKDVPATTLTWVGHSQLHSDGGSDVPEFEIESDNNQDDIPDPDDLSRFEIDNNEDEDVDEDVI